jgi:hypothetical protein
LISDRAELAAAKRKQELSNLSAEEFLQGGFLKHLNDESEDDEAIDNALNSAEQAHVADDEAPAASTATRSTGKRKQAPVAEAKAVKTRPAKKGDELDEHQRQLDNLARTDPKFYSFLQKESKELLNFTRDSDKFDAADDDDDDDAAAAATRKRTSKATDEDDDSDEDDDLDEGEVTDLPSATTVDTDDAEAVADDDNEEQQREQAKGDDAAAAHTDRSGLPQLTGTCAHLAW